MSMLRALSMLGQVGGGFMQGQQSVAAEKRKQDDADWQTQQRQRMADQQAREDQLRNDLQGAAATVAPQQTTAEPDMVDSRHVGTPVPTGYLVDGQQYPDQASAAAAGSVANTPAARMSRVADVYAKAGQIDQYDKLHTRADDLKNEGALQVINDLRTAMPSPDALADGKTVDIMIPESVRQNFDGMGKLRVPPGAKAQAFMNDDTPDIRIVGQDGKVIVGSANTLEGIIGMSASERRKQALELSKVKSEDKYKTTMTGIAQQNADTAKKEAADKGLYYSGIVKSKEDAIDAKPDRMSEADKYTLQDINKRAELINSEIVKAQAGGMWDENNPNAKALRTQQATLRMQAQGVLSRYAQEGASPDPLGIRGSGAPAASAPGRGPDTRVNPADQAARDVDAGKQMVMSEFGGNVARAEAELAQMQEGLRRAPAGDAKSMLASQAARLQAGIAAVKATSAAPRSSMTTAGAAPTPQPAPAGVTMAGAQAAPVAIPGPPPQTRQIGLSLAPNPAYADWEARFGNAWRAQQAARQQSEADAAAAAQRGYNPYQQNRVR